MIYTVALRDGRCEKTFEGEGEAYGYAEWLILEHEATAVVYRDGQLVDRIFPEDLKGDPGEAFDWLPRPDVASET
jgi:hypothetical protein